MTQTDKLNLPLIEVNQLQKHITHNEAVLGLEALTQLCLQDLDQNTPPLSPALGTAWGVGASPTDTWTDHPGEIASYDQFGWRFHDPTEGMIAWVASQEKLFVFRTGSWQVLDQQPTELQNANMVGVATSADATNKLSVKSDAILFSHADAGTDVRLKLNKPSAGGVASCVFQTAWSGTAEFGAIGNNDFSIKTSANGADWNTNLVCDVASGRVNIPVGLGEQAIGVANKINLLPNSGRLATEKSIGVTGFVQPTEIAAENGATITSFAKFETDSVDYGGAAPANNADVKQLVDWLRSLSAAKAFPEFWAAEVTAGSGTDYETSVSGSSKYRVLTLDYVTSTKSGISFYFKVVTGSVIVSAEQFDVWLNDVPVASFQTILPSDGWQHINVLNTPSTTDATNRADAHLPLFANNSDKFVFALPALLPDAVRVSADEGLIGSIG